MKLRTYGILLGAILLLLGGIILAAGRSYIAINVQGARAGQDIVYTIFDQDSKQTITETSQATTYKKLLPTGNYEVTVKQGEQTYFKITRAQRFMTTSVVDAAVQPEKSRSYIGNNPKSCIQLLGDRLLSIPCGDTVTNLQIHQPANAVSPTFTSKSRTPLSGFLQSTLTINNVTYALIKATPSTDSDGAPYTLYVLSNTGSLTNGLALSDLDPTLNFVATAYQKGVLVYSTTGDDMYYYPTVAAKPSKLSIPGPTDNEMTFNNLTTYKDAVVVGYSYTPISQIPGAVISVTEELELDNEDSPKTKAGSEILVYRNNKTTHFKTDSNINYAQLCSDSYICIYQEGTLQVFEINDDTLRLDYQVSGVSDFMTTANGIRIVRGDGVVNFDIASKQGNYEYTFGAYAYCGLQNDSLGYVLCIRNDNERTAALRIDTSADNGDSIDKKVSRLARDDAVRDVSIYGSFISISPKLGELEYDPAINGYRNNSDNTRQTTAQIDQLYDLIGFDRARYTVTTTIK